MNRTGLLIALAVAALVGVVFGLFPQLDLAFSRFFFELGGNEFIRGTEGVPRLLRDVAMWVVTGLAVPAAGALLLKLALPRRRMLVSGRAAVFLLATLALAPGLVVNGVLKDQWPRSRPIDVPQFGGQERFTAWWDPRGGCAQNCSFVSGEASGAFWTYAPAALAPPQWRPAAYAAATAFGLATGTLRMAKGGHFASDVLFAGVFTFLIVWLVHGLIYRWPRTRLAEDAVERAIERVARGPHDAVRQLWSRVMVRDRAP